VYVDSIDGRLALHIPLAISEEEVISTQLEGNIDVLMGKHGYNLPNIRLSRSCCQYFEFLYALF
jgi:hypothetical protein